MANELFGRKIRIEFENEKWLGGMEKSMGNNGLQIDFDIPFNQDVDPSESTVTIYNLSKESQNKITKGTWTTVYAGYGDDIGILSQGQITKVEKAQNNLVDSPFTFYFTEGKKSDEKKDIEMSFSKGTTGKTIIERIAGKAKIRIERLELKNNKTYKDGYTASGRAVDIIKEVAEYCESNFYYRRGQINIRSIKTDADSVELSYETGLINDLSRFEEENELEDDKKETIKGYNLQMLLQHRMAVGTTVKIKTKFVNGTYHVRSGSHHCDDSSFITELEVVE